MTSPRTTQGSRPPFRRGGRRRRQCFCKENTIDYKDVSSIRRFITDRGRIEAGKKSGNCAKCQRNLTTAIKRARHLALLPFAPDHLRVTGSVTTSTRISDDEEKIPEPKDDEKAEASAESRSTDGAGDTSETGEIRKTAVIAGADETSEAEADEQPEAAADTAVTESEADDSSPEPEESAGDASTDEVVTTGEAAETPVSEGEDTEAEADDALTEAPEDTVKAETDEDDPATEAESEEPSDDVSTTEPESEAEAEASTDEEDK